MTQNNTKKNNKNTSARGLAVILAIVITLVVITLSQTIAQLQGLGYIGAFFIMLISNATVVLPAPGLVFVIAMGRTLNPFLLGLFAGPGAAIGEMTGYMAGYGGATPIEHTNIYQRFDKLMDKFGLWFVFALSIIPNPFIDIAGLLAGAAHLPKWKFFLTVLVGKIIQSTFLAWAGALSINWIINLYK